MDIRRGRDMKQYSLEFVVDLLNLVFGKGNETEQFWEQHLIP